PVNAMVGKKRGVQAKCSNVQKAREAMAQRRAADAEAKAQALVAEAEAKAQADAGAYEAQLHQLQADLQQREQQVADTQRLQHAQQQLHDIQREEIQRKEQQVLEQQHQLQQQQADLHLREQQVAEQHQLQQQQQADRLLREQQVTEQHHQLQQQQADVLLRERQVAEQQHQLQQQQQADRLLREKHVAEQQHQLQLQQQLNRLQQQLEAQSGAELQRQVQQQLAVQQHLLQQQHADLLLKQQHVEKQLQEAADQQGVSTNHPLPDHPTCSPLLPGSLRSPLFKRPRQDTTQANMPRHHSVAHALRIPGLPYSAVVGAHQSRSLATAPPPPIPIMPHAVKRARRSHLSNLAAGAAADWAAAPLRRGRRCLSQEQLEYVRTFFEEHSSPSPMYKDVRRYYVRMTAG
ncbi:hypothetical protein QJQ45_015772, partial [Haematococcus lacustris]